MLAFPDMLVPSAESAGMKVPKDTESFDANEFPHFFVYREIQIGRPIVGNTSHWENAKIIAGVTDDKIRLVTYSELLEMGIQ